MKVSDLNLAVGILARNCADALAANIDRVENLCSKFKCASIAIYENNSTDSTKNILKEWKACSNYNIFLQSEDLVFPPKESIERYPSKGYTRIQRMADCRNKLQGLLSEIPSDITILIDIDLASFDANEICAAIEKAPADWGGIFANSYSTRYKKQKLEKIPIQYDTYAIVKANEEPLDYGRIYLNPVTSVIRGRLIDHCVQKNAYYPVKSAFGGVGVYKTCVIKDLIYTVPVPSKWEKYNAVLCEHYSVNSQILDKGLRCYICRDMKSIYGTKKKNGLKGVLLSHFPTLYYIMDELL